ncbi:FCS-Like Zinc finger 6-like [Magnolia sinica]|uniref:FCS-Like Zinc finger 6-like n=1 Tax=Magnolia sinica TaxID=86752 RepID=UPI00265AAF1B|nr:FCS-Like Zinc finger 6-like [Magnolia sinica]
MLLGKRPRPPIRRTTSMNEFSLDISTVQMYPQPHNTNDHQKPSPEPASVRRHQVVGGSTGFDTRFLSAISPRNLRSSADFLDTANFMRACGLCKRRLGPSRDIYMYRGDSAFCSLECRQQQMNQDERKEKSSLASMKKEATCTATSET